MRPTWGMACAASLAWTFLSTSIAFLQPSLLPRPLLAAAAAGENRIEERQADGWDLALFSPAKINLFLRILRKRPDGYHDLASLFQTVAFGDTLYLSKIKEDQACADEFSCSEPSLSGRSNLVIRALNLLRDKTGTNQFFQVHLQKQIPAQAGMGGGSGNAATALFAANELMGCPASPQDLELWSAELGSDITFFLSEGSCYCTGRGEVLHPQPAMEPCESVWLIKPSEGLSTPEVFRNLVDYDLLSKEDPKELLASFYQEGVKGGRYVNDLELPAFKAMPKLKQMKQELMSLEFQAVLMSGSGTTIFALGQPNADKDWTKDFCQKYSCRIWKTEFINRSAGNPHLWYGQKERFYLSS